MNLYLDKFVVDKLLELIVSYWIPRLFNAILFVSVSQGAES